MRRHRFPSAIAALAILASFGSPASAADPPQRIVSLIPSVTEMLFAIGAGARVVGVSTFDRFPPEVERIPRVGALLDPNTEQILALKPDLVVLYNSQVELKQRLDRVGIPYYSYEHRALPDVLSTLRGIGARIGMTARSEAVARAMEGSILEVRTRTLTLPHPRTLLVFGREPSSLRNVEASGGYGFLHDMLEVAGGQNVFADIKRQSVQASTETILTRAPEVIIELRYGDAPRSGGGDDLAVWNALPSLPAVRNRRVYVLTGDEFVVPGPRVVDAIHKLAGVLHPATR